MTSRLRQAHQGLRNDPNYIIAGSMDFALEGYFPSVNLINGQYMMTLFKFHKSGAMELRQPQSTDVPAVAEAGFRARECLSLTVQTVDASIAAGDHARFDFFVEGHRLRRLLIDGESLVVFSMLVKFFKTGTYGFAVRNGGATPDASYVDEFTVNASDVWELKTFIVPLGPGTAIGSNWDYVNGIGLRCTITLAAGTDFQTAGGQWTSGNKFATLNQVNGVDSTSNTFKIALVDGRPGSVPQPFVPVGGDYDRELEHIGRLYEKSYNLAVIPGTVTHAGVDHEVTNSSGVFRQSRSFLVAKRVTPSITYYNPQTGTAGEGYDGANRTFSQSPVYVGEGRFTTGETVGLDSLIRWHWTADARF